MRVAVLTLLFLSCGPGVSSLFEGDDEGWKLSGNGEEAMTPELKREGGNPSGHICATDALVGDLWYFVAPAKYLGDVSWAYGKRLTFDLQQSSMFNQIKGRDVVLNGGGLAITYNFTATPRRDWTPYSIRVDETSGWQLDTSPSGPASEQDVKTILKSLTSLRIRGEFVDGPDSACLDNVVLGRE